jgi:CrcB protein
MDSPEMTTALLIALGSAFGAPARFLVDQYFKKFTEKPIGTFVVNVIGSFFIGLTFASAEHWHDFIAVGFAGSFTTWSTFMLDLYLGIRLKRYNPTLINFVASITVGLLAARFGVSLVN